MEIVYGVRNGDLSCKRQATVETWSPWGWKRLRPARGEVGRKRWRGVQGVHEVSRGDREEGRVGGRAHLSRCFVPGQDAIRTVGDK